LDKSTSIGTHPVVRWIKERTLEREFLGMGCYSENEGVYGRLLKFCQHDLAPSFSLHIHSPNGAFIPSFRGSRG
jgi:hypothetical protein